MPDYHRRTSEPGDGLYGPCFVENNYGDYRTSSQSNSIRANGASIGGGGSEVLVLEPICFRDDITIKISEGGLRSNSTRCTGSNV